MITAGANNQNIYKRLARHMFLETQVSLILSFLIYTV